METILKTIIVAEDDLTLNELYVEVLESYGFKSIGFEDGKKALLYAITNKVDFILTDLKMPTMDGIELLEEIRNIHPKDPPVLIITGYADAKTRQQAQNLGAIGLLSKPFNFDEIIKIINTNIKS
ncbi:response regulator [Halobacteriovorax sp.]|uniref:response regulator n=1 Tax=Halobacteriovorax sp. TaxID=2020862 RepID=UPI003AF2EC8A